MLSGVSAIFSSDPMVVTPNPFLSLENGFTPWDGSDLFSSPPQSPKPAGSGSGSGFGSGSDELNRSDRNTSNLNSGSDGLSQSDSAADDRRRRRKISNRESARRSRMRKQKHLENLRNQVNRLRTENRDLSNRLSSILFYSHRARTDSDRLLSERNILRKNLSEIRQILKLRQLQVQQFTPAWPCKNLNMTAQIL